MEKPEPQSSGSKTDATTSTTRSTCDSQSTTETSDSRSSQSTSQLCVDCQTAKPSKQSSFEQRFRRHIWERKVLYWSWLSQIGALLYCLIVLYREVKNAEPSARLVKSILGPLFYDLRPPHSSTRPFYFRLRLRLMLVGFMAHLITVLGEILAERGDALDVLFYFGLYGAKVLTWAFLSSDMVDRIDGLDTEWSKMEVQRRESLIAAPVFGKLYWQDAQVLQQPNASTHKDSGKPSFSKLTFFMLASPVLFAWWPAYWYSRGPFTSRKKPDHFPFTRRFTPSNESGALRCSECHAESSAMESSDAFRLMTGRQPRSVETSTPSATSSEHLPRGTGTVVRTTHGKNPETDGSCEAPDNPISGRRDRSSDSTVLRDSVLEAKKTWTLPRMREGSASHSTGISDKLQPTYMMSGALRRSSDHQG